MENKFETKLASELEDLSFKPQERVWENVLKATQKKKKRSPYPIFFTIMGLVAVFLFTANFLKSNKSNEENIISSNNNETKNIKTINENENERKDEKRNEITPYNKEKNNELKIENSKKTDSEFNALENNVNIKEFENHTNYIKNKINKENINKNQAEKTKKINNGSENLILNTNNQSDFITNKSISNIEYKNIDETNELEIKKTEKLFQDDIALTKISFSNVNYLSIDKKITNSNLININIPNYQNKIIKLKKESKNIISLEMSFNSNHLINYELLTGSKEKALNNSNTSQSNADKNNIVQFSPSYGFKFGVGYQRKLNKNLSIITGISFLNKTINSFKKSDSFISNMNVISISSNSYNNRIYSLETNNILNTKNSFNYISVPIQLEKNILKFKKVDITALFGTTLNLLINAKAIGSNTDGNVLLPFNSKINIISPNLSFGLNIGFYGKFPIKIGLENEMGLLQISPLVPFNKKYFQTLQFKLSLPLYKF